VPIILATTGVLALGLAGGVAIVLVRDHDSSSTAANIAVDTSPINTASSAASGNDAVRVSNQLGPAVGTIVVSGGSGGGGSLGSGFVISNSGGTSYLVTNNHVVSGASDVRVLMPDGKNLPGTVVGTDQLDDLAVVSVKDGHLPTAVFGLSSQLTVGQEVIAIGSPLGNQGTVTSGVVSALHRSISAGSGGPGGASEQLQDVLQTSAPINPGNSGGPLADAEGRVVGVNVATAAQSSNIGFSIPSDVASRVVQSLMQGQQFKHPFIGIATEDQLSATQRGNPFDGPGVLVTSVSNSSPASDAGVHQGDIITKMDGTLLDQGETVGGVLQRHNVGDTISMEIKRGGQTLTVHVKLAARPDGI
jgi:S1-C subfamily serine protease